MTGGAAASTAARSGAASRERTANERSGGQLLNELGQPRLVPVRGLALDDALRRRAVEDGAGLLERDFARGPRGGPAHGLDRRTHAGGGGDVPLAAQLVRADALLSGLVMRHGDPPKTCMGWRRKARTSIRFRLSTRQATPGI